jgi:hypothetical protein
LLQEETVDPQAAARAARDRDLAAVLARQSDLEKRMRELNSASSAASADAGGASTGAAASPISQMGTVLPPISVAPSFAWLSQLRDPQGARRAMVMREVLGPPVGMRR